MRQSGDAPSQVPAEVPAETAAAAAAADRAPSPLRRILGNVKPHPALLRAGRNAARWARHRAQAQEDRDALGLGPRCRLPRALHGARSEVEGEWLRSRSKCRRGHGSQEMSSASLLVSLLWIISTRSIARWPASSSKQGRQHPSANRHLARAPHRSPQVPGKAVPDDADPAPRSAAPSAAAAPACRRSPTAAHPPPAAVASPTRSSPSLTPTSTPTHHPTQGWRPSPRPARTRWPSGRPGRAAARRWTRWSASSSAACARPSRRWTPAWRRSSAAATWRCPPTTWTRSATWRGWRRSSPCPWAATA